MSGNALSMSRDDLLLLMKSYENNIQLNTTMIEKQNLLLEKQGELLNQQKDVLNLTREILINLSDHSKELKRYDKEIIECLNNNIKNNDEISKKIDSSVEKHTAHEKECLKGFSSLKNRLYLTMAAFTGIVGTLFIIILNFSDKLKLLEKIIEILSKGA